MCKFCLKGENAYLENKAERASQGECAAQRRLSEAEAEMDRREGKGEMQNLLSMKLADILNPREGSSIR